MGWLQVCASSQCLLQECNKDFNKQEERKDLQSGEERAKQIREKYGQITLLEELLCHFLTPLFAQLPWSAGVTDICTLQGHLHWKSKDKYEPAVCWDAGAFFLNQHWPAGRNDDGWRCSCTDSPGPGASETWTGSHSACWCPWPRLRNPNPSPCSAWGITKHVCLRKHILKQRAVLWKNSVSAQPCKWHSLSSLCVSQCQTDLSSAGKWENSPVSLSRPTADFQWWFSRTEVF